MYQHVLRGFAFLLLLTVLSPVSGAASAPAKQAAVDAPELAEGVLANTEYAWIDITALGQALESVDWVTANGEHKDDEGQASVGLPWTFPWFGQNYSKVYIDANGNVGFEDWTEDTWRSDNRIPSASQPNNRIAAFYEDMAGRDTGACQGNEGAVYTYHDHATNRFVIEYSQWCSWEDYGLNTFEVILYPDGRVVVQYQTMPSAPANLPYGNPPGPSIAGVESPDGTSGRLWGGTIADGSAWLYQPYETIGANKIYLPLIR